MPYPLARVIRSQQIESIHYGHAVLLSANGSSKFWGEPEFKTYVRSCLKPLQAKVAKDILAGQLAGEFLAIACSSHTAQQEHLKVLERFCKKFSISSRDLHCGLHQDPKRQLPSRLNHNCSGKHLALIAATKQSSPERLDYWETSHPIQLRIKEELFKHIGSADIVIGQDGCGLPTFYLSLMLMAKLFLGIIQDPAYQEIIQAMNKFPTLIRDSKGLDAILMSRFPNKFLAKGGAEGMTLIANLETTEVLIIKIVDGSSRAKEIIAKGFLEQLTWIDTNSLELDNAIYDSNLQKIGQIEALAC